MMTVIVKGIRYRYDRKIQQKTQECTLPGKSYTTVANTVVMLQATTAYAVST